MRLNGGQDFSRTCSAGQSHTTAGTALQNALLGSGRAKACESKESLWLPAQALCSTQLPNSTIGARARSFGPSGAPRPEEVRTQRLPAPPAPAAATPWVPSAPSQPRERPASGRVRAQTDPGVKPPAGMRTPRAVRAWQSADEAMAAEIRTRPPGGGPDVAVAEDAGWAPNRQFSPEELRYNPITHQVEVFVNVDGDVQKCLPTAEEYREMLLRLESAAPHKGRRKGLSEFVDLCCAGRARPNPHIKAAYQQNRRVFQKQRGPCTMEIAKGYPGNPRVFEPDPRISMPAGQIPRPFTPAPTPVRPPSAPARTGGNRVRRPNSARGASRPPQTISAPPSRIADDGG
ncbi:unnamed protein product [Effrenium voratum]|nr:unnamed protein product [Effrenium voratum]